MNSWHNVHYGNKAPEEVNVVIEVPKYSNMKYELDKNTGLLMLDRALYSAVYYPGNYGFIPRTYWEDHDPLDIMILGNSPIYPLTIVKARPIGVLQMKDEGESDDKIIAVAVDDPRFEEIVDVGDLPHHMMREITNFFETYKMLQNKNVKVFEVKGEKVAKQAIKKAIKMYADKFEK